MQNRGLTSASITALGGANVEFYHLLRIDFTVPLYYTDAPYDIEHEGNTYQPSGVPIKLPDAKESLKIKPQTITIELSGAVLATHALLLTENYKNASVYIYRHIVETGQTVPGFFGFCDSYSSKEDTRGKKSIVSLKIANHWSNWDATNGRVISDNDQQRLHSGDKFFEYVGVTDPILSYWGKVQDSGGRWVGEADYNPVYVPWMTLDGRTYYDDFVDSSIYDFESKSADSKILPTIYGTKPVIGTPVFRELTGSDLEYLWVVYSIAEGTVDSLLSTQFYDGDIGKDYSDSEYNGSVSAPVFYDGSQTTADATLIAASPKWTSAHVGNGVVYAIIKYNKKLFEWQGEPQPVFKIKGKELYDPRDGSTAYSNNPALIMYDYMTSTSYGKALSSSDIDIDSIKDGADYCETQQTDHDAGLGGTPATINLFELHGTVDNAKSIKKNMENILFTMRGHLPWIAGKYTFVIERHDDESVYSFNEDNIAGSFQLKEKGIKDLANIVYYEWIDPAIAEGRTTEISSSATYLAADNNRVLSKKVSNKYENNRYRAKNRAATILKKTRQQVDSDIKAANADSYQIQTGKIVDITRESQGWIAKTFRVIDMVMGKDGDNSFTLEEYEPSVYSWDISVEETPPANTEHVNPNVVTAPTGLTVTATDTEAIDADDGTTLHRLKVTWTASVSAFVSGYNVQYRENGASNWIDYQDAPGQATAEIYIPGVVVGSYYDVRIRSFNSLGISSAWVTETNTAVTGVMRIGLTAETYGTDSVANSSNFRHETFDTLDHITTTGTVALNAADNSIGFSGDGFTSPSAIIYESLTKTDRWSFGKDRHFAGVVKNTGWDNTTIGTAYLDILTGSGGDAYGIRMKWNNSTSKIDIYGLTIRATSGTLSLIASVNSGATFVFDAILNAGTDVTFTVDGANETVISTNIPSLTASNAFQVAGSAFLTGWITYIGELWAAQRA